MHDTIKVTIYTPEGVYLETECEELSSRNILGEFNILPEHTNFITNINDNVTLFLKDGSKNEIPVQMGVLRIADNVMEIFLVLSPILKPTER